MAKELPESTELVLTKLTLCAIKVMARKGFEENSLLAGKGPVDFAWQAMEKFLNEVRQCDDDATPRQKYKVMAGTIFSDVDSAYRNQHVRFHHQTTDNIDNEHFSCTDAIFNAIASIEQVQKFISFIKREYQRLLPMVESIIYKGLDKPREIAQDLKISIETVYNQKKQLMRAVSKFNLLIEGDCV